MREHISTGAVVRGLGSSAGEEREWAMCGPEDGGWVVYRFHRGSPHLERMYYVGALLSSDFRTDFLVPLLRRLRNRTGRRSHPRNEIAETVPSTRESVFLLQNAGDRFV